jgi:outer membrane immunogenic protein
MDAFAHPRLVCCSPATRRQEISPLATQLLNPHGSLAPGIVRSRPVTIGGDAMLKSFAFALSGLSFFALNAAVQAADMPVKAPPAAVEEYSWTGFYVGLHMGGGWPEDPNSTVTMQRFTGAASHPLQLATFNTGSFAFGGAQIGYNLQVQRNWLIGIEADISAAGGRYGFSTVLAEGPITDTVTVARGPDWFGTVRGRLGYLFAPRWLVYGTGGLVYGHDHNDFAQAITGPGPVGTFAIVNTAPSTSLSWTAGGGIEYALDRRWSAKLEYEYLAFRDGVSSSTTITFTPGGRGNVGVFNVQSPNNGEHTIQVGLNYRLSP